MHTCPRGFIDIRLDLGSEILVVCQFFRRRPFGLAHLVEYVFVRYRLVRCKDCLNASVCETNVTQRYIIA